MKKNVCFASNFWEVIQGKLRNPFQSSKISTVLHELDGFPHATALSLKIGYYTMRLDLDTSKTLYHHPSLGPVLPQELTVEMAGSPDYSKEIVGANGILRRCMSSP
jgi:hypothetical protein